MQDIGATQSVNEVFRILDLTGVFANAVLGGIVARRERLDPIGFVTLAVLSGLGGGLIRDITLQSGPPVAVTDNAYLITAIAGATVSFLMQVEGRVWRRTWPVVDALALGAWATAGAQKTLAVGLGWLPAILLGVITAVGGGALRDITVRRVPGVLGGNTLYATAALVGASVLVLMSTHGYSGAGSIVATVVGAGLCLVARWRGWILPSADAWSAAARTVPNRYRGRWGAARGRGNGSTAADDGPIPTDDAGTENGVTP